MSKQYLDIKNFEISEIPDKRIGEYEECMDILAEHECDINYLNVILKHKRETTKNLKDFLKTGEYEKYGKDESLAIYNLDTSKKLFEEKYRSKFREFTNKSIKNYNVFINKNANNQKNIIDYNNHINRNNIKQININIKYSVYSNSGYKEITAILLEYPLLSTQLIKDTRKDKSEFTYYIYRQPKVKEASETLKINGNELKNKLKKQHKNITESRKYINNKVKEILTDDFKAFRHNLRLSANRDIQAIKFNFE